MPTKRLKIFSCKETQLPGSFPLALSYQPHYDSGSNHEPENRKANLNLQYQEWTWVQVEPKSRVLKLFKCNRIIVHSIPGIFPGSLSRVVWQEMIGAGRSRQRKYRNKSRPRLGALANNSASLFSSVFLCLREGSLNPGYTLHPSLSTEALPVPPAGNGTE